MPKQPARAKAFRSAWIPAPPPESEPAIVRQRGTRTSAPTLASTQRTRTPEEVPMTGTYTHTTWRVKPGQEEEFVRRWAEWAEWSHRQGLGDSARLLRDVERPGTFISFAPWASADAVRNWRSLEGYHER